MFVINGTIYLLFGLFSGHFRRDLAPASDQLRPRHIAADIWNHLRLRRPRGEAAKRYNVLQKLTYLAVIFLLLPAILAQRPDHVACRHRRVPVPLRSLRRAAVGAHDPFHRRQSPAALRARPRRRGLAVGRLQSHAFDDHRPLCRSNRSAHHEPHHHPPQAAHHRCRGRRHHAARRLRSALRSAADAAAARFRPDAVLSRAPPAARGSAAGARIRARRYLARFSLQRHRDAERLRLFRLDHVELRQLASSRSTAWSATSCRCRSTRSSNCRRARRSPSTVATKVGPRSASGRASRLPISCRGPSSNRKRASSSFIVSTR